MRAEDWPQFRGANGAGVSLETGLPTEWSAESVAWSVPLPGQANSAPAVTARRVDITTRLEDGSLWVHSYDKTTGRLQQKTQVGSGELAAKGSPDLWAHRHNAATPSPVSDERHVWAFFGTGLLACVDAEAGRLRWQRDLAKDYGAYDITFGMGSSPRLFGDLLLISCLTKGPSYVVALDKATGREVWKVDRKLPAKDDGPDAYSTPTIAVTKSGPQLLVAGSDHIDAYDPLTGKRLWVSGGLTIESPYGRVIASPQMADGMVVATSANPGGGGLGRMIGVRGGGRGDVTATHRVWEIPKTSPDSSSPVLYRGHVYALTDAGIALCLDLQTGQVRWRERLGTGPVFHASLVAGDGKIYCLDIEGQCVVIEANAEKMNVLARNKLPGTFYATPAISDGMIFLRSYQTLYAVSAQPSKP